MFKHYFELVEGVAIYPIISLFIFFFFFVGLGVYVMRMKKTELEALQNLPLENSDISHTSNT